MPLPASADAGADAPLASPCDRRAFPTIGRTPLWYVNEAIKSEERTTIFMVGRLKQRRGLSLSPAVGSWPDRVRMDLPPIGTHCSLPSCRVLDLLPIRCRCDKQFCKDHIFPDDHQCPVDLSQAPRDASPTALPKLQRCALVSCNKPSLNAYAGDSAREEGGASALCPRCTLAYCAS